MAFTPGFIPSAAPARPSAPSTYVTPDGQRIVALQSEGGATCNCLDGQSCLNNGQ
jgi:hypothetical protein